MWWVNSGHIKAVPGRKTDVGDREGLADLLRHGLVRASFIAPREIREIRELTRYRQGLVKDPTAVANRIEKLLEGATLKLGQVASDVLGVSGRLMLRALATGEQEAHKVAGLAQGRLKSKTAELEQALQGALTPAHRWVLGELLRQAEELDAALTRVDSRIGAEIETCADPFAPEAVEILDSIPGVGPHTAPTLLAEMGLQMEQFPSAGHLSSWAGMCPGNHESAGKRHKGTTTKGSPYLRTALIEAAWAASHSKGTYLAGKYYHLVKRMGKKKALVAIGHKIVVLAYHLLRLRVGYRDCAAAELEQQQVARQRRQLIRKLEALGVKVSLEEVEQAA